jgi:hypothetical protein
MNTDDRNFALSLQQAALMLRNRGFNATSHRVDEVALYIEELESRIKELEARNEYLEEFYEELEG